MNIIRHILPFATIAMISVAHGDTNELSLRYEPLLPDIDGYRIEEPDGFWERFERSLDVRTEQAFTDRLHPLKVPAWSRLRSGDSWQDVVERGDRKIKSSLSRSIEYSLRDAAVGLPLTQWFEDQEEMVSELFVSSVDAVEEEAVAPLNPSYRPGERRWWQELAEKRVMRYGVRPFRTDPYTFVSMRLQEGDHVNLLGHLRYRFKNFSEHRFELAMSLPLAHGLAFDLGTAYQFGRNEDEKKVVLKLFKPLPRGGIVHLGVEVQRSPTFFAGLFIPL